MSQLITAFIIGIVLLMLLLFVLVFIFLLRYARKQKLVAKVAIMQNQIPVSTEEIKKKPVVKKKVKK